YIYNLCFIVFFFQAEDGIRDFHVTGVQTCALPILTKTWVKVPWAQAVLSPVRKMPIPYSTEVLPSLLTRKPPSMASGKEMPLLRSEERRVGNDCGPGL